MQPTGAAGRWPRPQVFRSRACIASGEPSACNRTGSRPSSSPPTRCLSRRCVTSQGSTSLVLCVDEKSQIQALDRSQPVLPMRPGPVERRTHDYTRHGTPTLFAALNTKSGKLITAFRRRQRAREFRKFLDTIHARVPATLEVHLILDNSSTHKTPAIHRWLTRHPRFHLHFTPTSSSWINLV